MMIHTNALEKEMTAGTSYLDCFKGVDLPRTEASSGAWMIQNLCGSAFMGYSTYFLTMAGMAETYAFDMSIAQYGIGIIGTVSSWFLMPHFGRRKLYLFGEVGMIVMLVTIGGMGFISTNNSGGQWAIGGLLLGYTLIYDTTVGPVCYALVAELSSTRLRAKTVVIARIAYNLIGIVNSVIMVSTTHPHQSPALDLIDTLQPYFLNPEKLNWGGKTGLFWAGFCLICLIWTYFRLPEPKGRTYGELDVLFENRVPARKFATTQVDQFADGGHGRRSPEVFDEKTTKFDHIEN
jgi:SP family general alpha glucoside:H+ symporter-like MFS transporter